MLFDTHAHIADKRFDADRQQMIAAFAPAGIGSVCVVGGDLTQSQAALDLAAQHDMLWAAVGLCPQDARVLDDAQLAWLRSMAGHAKTVIVGEIGLDYYYDTTPRDVQMTCLAQQEALANELNLPVTYHVRDAWGDFLEHIRQKPVKGGIMHCWSGSVEAAKICLDAGLYISLAGTVTFANAHKLRDVARYLPADRLLLETDCPYLAPVPLRGRRNEPAFVRHTAQVVADLRGVPLAQLEDETYANALRVFALGA
ncbi:MAG: TatD family hydrolase [Eubacteriales bacterium]|nr:TatD family hydrolase [Eubacteriales bacterium]